jgi:ABC-type polysaccharide/polyol phosphate transport system ATPase subunit
MEQQAAGRSLARRVQNLWTRSQEFWAVRDVSFEVERGQALGVIGHNGAGKSTILKLLSGITTPTRGEIEISGRLSALIEVGSGFHPDLTGRENIYLNGSILGMRRREITKKLDSIVEFAGVEQFIDTPVKRYSSGMYLRLGFSIAAHLDPDILLLDEVLAVGDAGFQARCIQRVSELKQAGTTIVFISHDLKSVERVCDRVLLMQKGEVISDGSPRDVIAEYERALSNFAPSSPKGELAATAPKKVEVISVNFYDSDGGKTTAYRRGDPITAEIRYEAREWVEDVVFELYFYTIFGNLHAQFTTELSDERIDLHPGTGSIEFFAAEMGLEPATFNIQVIIKHRGEPSTRGIDWKHAAILNVGHGKMVEGWFYMPHTWRIKETDGSSDDTSPRNELTSETEEYVLGG